MRQKILLIYTDTHSYRTAILHTRLGQECDLSLFNDEPPTLAHPDENRRLQPAVAQSNQTRVRYSDCPELLAHYDATSKEPRLRIRQHRHPASR
jgi:hypothetical protein